LGHSQSKRGTIWDDSQFHSHKTPYKWTYIKLCHTYIHHIHTCIHTYICICMPFMDEKFCAIRWHPPTTLPKKNTHLMLYKPFRRIPYLKDGLIYQRLRERTTLKRTPNLKNKGLLQRQRMLNQQWVLMAFFVLSASSFFLFFFPCLPFTWFIHHFEGKKTDGRCPDTNYGSCYEHFGHVIIDTKRPYIIRHYFLFYFILFWSAPRCVWSSPDTSGREIGQSGRKKKEADNTWVL